MTANDLDLLGQFAREQSQDAFTALVNRHLNLVYSAALRQVRSPQLAEEVSQSVFANLARNAAKLKPGHDPDRLALPGHTPYGHRCRPPRSPAAGARTNRLPDE